MFELENSVRLARNVFAFFNPSNCPFAVATTLLCERHAAHMCVMAHAPECPELCRQQSTRQDENEKYEDLAHAETRSVIPNRTRAIYA